MNEIKPTYFNRLLIFQLSSTVDDIIKIEISDQHFGQFM
jgi:hypothetical protein